MKINNENDFAVKWHDLQKDPTDLPPVGQSTFKELSHLSSDVVIALKGGAGIYTKGAKWDSKTNSFVGCSIPQVNVIAWREMPKYPGTVCDDEINFAVKWHDLQKDPTDLPKHEEDVLCCGRYVDSANKPIGPCGYFIDAYYCDQWQLPCEYLAWRELTKYPGTVCDDEIKNKEEQQ